MSVLLLRRPRAHLSSLDYNLPCSTPSIMALMVSFLGERSAMGKHWVCSPSRAVRFLERDRTISSAREKKGKDSKLTSPS